MDLQPQYYYTSSLMEALDLLEKFCQNSERPFNARLSKDGKSILYDRNIKFKMNKWFTSNKCWLFKSIWNLKIMQALNNPVYPGMN